MKLFVGNIAWKATTADLQRLFEGHGEVSSCKIIKDRQSGRPRGFGFIEMSATDASAAIEALHGYEFMGRELIVNEAEERKE